MWDFYENNSIVIRFIVNCNYKTTLNDNYSVLLSITGTVCNTVITLKRVLSLQNYP